MLLELGDIGVDPAGELCVVALIDGGVVHVPAGQGLGQGLGEHVVLLLHAGLMGGPPPAGPALVFYDHIGFVR